MPHQLNPSIPLFFLSFFNRPIGIHKKIVKKQRGFLWGRGEDGRKKICWVKLDNICLENERGWLGVKDLESFTTHVMSVFQNSTNNILMEI